MKGIGYLFGGLIVTILVLSCATTICYQKGTPESFSGITSLENIKINGLKHAVLIRSKNLDNPILLHLHGNGIPAMCFYHEEYINDPQKEEKFIIVHYDQRGCGKTYRHGGHSNKKITIDQYVSDAEELINYLLKRFDKQKIYLLGESWGSILGAKLVSRHPEWFYAYIAVPQVGNVQEYLRDAYNFSLQMAKSDSNCIAINDLEKYGLPVPGLHPKQLNKSIAITGKWMDYYNLKRYNGRDMTGYFFKSLWEAPEYTAFDFVSTLKGIMKTSGKLNKKLININLIDEVPEMKVSVYFITGEYDLMINTSKQYFDQLKAEKKVWLPIKNAGHMVRGEQYLAFDSLLYNTVLP
jgi:pimeloyl-ACP methyl ester carboxylesterase